MSKYGRKWAGAPLDSPVRFHYISQHFVKYQLQAEKYGHIDHAFQLLGQQQTNQYSVDAFLERFYNGIVGKLLVEGERMNNKDISKLHMIDAISTPYSDDFMKEVNRTLVGMMQPDPYGCEAFFVKTFINEEMQPDFGIIANIFYLNVPEALTFKNYEYYTETSIRSSYPVEVFSLFTLSQILSRAKAGNEFSVQLLKYLYKTYEMIQRNIKK